MAEDKNKHESKPDGSIRHHEWDGIQEYNNPLPRWWVWVFLITIVWAVGYCVFYPSWPMIHGFAKGTLGWSQYQQLDESVAAAQAAQKPFNDKVSSMGVDEVMNDPSLREFAVAGGKAAFALNCAQCHGSGAQGGKGFPNLLDDEWLWGGSLDAIEQTIRHGIRSPGDPETRQSIMQPWGKDKMLTKEQILAVVAHVRHISDASGGTPENEEGKTVFLENCAACHGENGQGSHDVGAPALNNQIWLYGGSEDTLYQTVYYGRGGVMPHWSGKLDDVTIKKLAIYIHSLSGGEKSVSGE